MLLYIPTTCGKCLSRAFNSLHENSCAILPFNQASRLLVVSVWVACGTYDLFIKSFVKSPTNSLPLSDWNVIRHPCLTIQTFNKQLQVSSAAVMQDTASRYLANWSITTSTWLQTVALIQIFWWSNYTTSLNTDHSINFRGNLIFFVSFACCHDKYAEVHFSQAFFKLFEKFLCHVVNFVHALMTHLFLWALCSSDSQYLAS